MKTQKLSQRFNFTYVLSLTGAICLLATAARADVTEITGSDNAYVLRSSANSDQDESQALSTKRLNDSNTRIAYVRFDLTTFLSNHSINGITAATLRLYQTSAIADTMKVYGLNSTLGGTNEYDDVWTGAMTWNNQPAGAVANSATGLPNTNTTPVLCSFAMPATTAEVDLVLTNPAFISFLTTNGDAKITLLFHNIANVSPSFASIANTGGNLKPTLELTAPISATGTINWSGATNGNWDTTTTNWISSGSPTNYISGDNVIFNDTLSGTANVNLTTALSPASITVTNNNTNYVFSGTGSISGVTSLVKQGTGTLLIDNSGVNNYGGGTLISAGVVQVGNNDTNGNLSGLTTNNSVLIFDRNNSTLTLNSAVSGTGSLIQNGSGTVTLTASNSYTGATVINGGTLALSATGSINGGSSLSLTNGTLSLAITPSLPTNITTGTLSTGGTTNLINITSVPGFPVYPTNITLIAYASANNLTVGNNQLATLGVKLPFAITVGYLTNLNNSIQLVLLNGPSPIVPISWSGLANGANNGNWDILTTSNWVNYGSSPAAPYYYQDASAVMFDDTAAGATNVVLNTTAQPASMNFSNGVLQYTVTGTGSISGTNSLTKNGTNLVTLAETGGDNFSGGISIGNDGNPDTLILSNANANISGGVIVNNGTLNDYHSGTIVGGMTLNNSSLALLDGPGTNSGGVYLNGSTTTLQIGNNDANGNLTGNITNNGVLIFNRSDSNLVVSGVISGSGAVTNNGSGIVTLSVSNSFSGGLFINNGTVRVASTGGGSTPLGGGNTTVNPSTTLVGLGADSFGYYPHTAPATIFILGGTVTDAGTNGNYRVTLPNLTLMGGALSSTSTNVGDAAGGNYSFFGTAGAATITTLATNVTAVINAAVVSMQSSTTLNAATGTTPGGVDLLITSKIQTYNNVPAAITINSSGNGVVAFDNNNTYGGATTISGGTLQLGTINDTNVLTEPVGTNTVNDNATLNLGSSQGITLTNVVSDNGSGTVVVSSGTNTFTAADTYGGNTMVLGGVLALKGAGSINNSTVVIVSNATLDLSAMSAAYANPNSLVMTNSTLNLGTNLVSNLGTLAISNATLTFPLNPNVTSISVINGSGYLMTGGTTNLIQITAVPGFPVYPTNITLISYDNTNQPIVDDNNKLTTLGVKLLALGNSTGYLTNITGSPNLIQLVLQSGPPPIVPITWKGQTNNVNVSSWDILVTPDWLPTGSTTPPYPYQDTSMVRFDDTASNGIVTVSQTVQPASVTVSNSTLQYTFAGNSGIGGTAGLLKQGSGALTLTETNDTFSGGIVMGGGSLILSNTGAAIAGGLTVTNGTLTVAHGGTISGGLTMNNTAGGSPVTLVVGSGTLAGGITNMAGNLTVSNAPVITGGLVAGGGTVLLDQTTIPTGTTTISNGATVNVGNNDVNGHLLSGTVTNNGALVFNQSANVTVSNVISGAATGTITQNNTNILTMSGNNTNYAGAIVVVLGTLQAGNGGALGATNGTTTIDSGATLDINGQNLGLEPVIVSGAGVTNGGAIVASVTQQTALQCVTLAGDTTFGGPTRWDLRTTAGYLMTGGNPYSITKIGPAQIDLVNITNIDLALSNIVVQGGIFGIEQMHIPTAEVGTNGAIIVYSNAAVEIDFGITNLAKPVVLLDGGTLLESSGSNYLVGPVTLSTNLAGGAGNCTFNIGGTSLAEAGAISGPGNLMKIGGSPLYLSGTNTYTGNTIVSNGTLALANTASIGYSTNITVASNAVLNVNGRTDGTLTLNAGQNLFDNGTVTGNMTNNSGAAIFGSGTVSGTIFYNGGTLSPGATAGTIGTLIMNGTLNMSLGGTTIMKLNKSQSPSNDVVVILVAGAIGYGGTLTVTNLGPALVAGDSFQLFNVSGSHFQSFSVTNLPPLNAGLAWTNSGGGTVWSVISVASPISNLAITGFNLSNGTNLVINGTNAGVGLYYVLASTNVALPLANWTAIATNAAVGSGSFSFTATNVVNAAAVRQQFYILSTTNN